MKKLLPFILLAALTACASPAEVPTPTPTLAPEPTPAPTAEPAAADFYPLDLYDDTFNSGDAYYEFAQKTGYTMLLKTDYATAAQSVCCEIPGCTHDSDACPAYFPGQVGWYRVVSAQDAVYVWHVSFFYTEKTWDEFYAETVAPQLENPQGMTAEEMETHYRGVWAEMSAPPRLYTVSPSGGKTYVDLPLDVRPYQMQYCDGTALYGIYPQPTPYANAVTTCRVELSTGAVDYDTLLPSENYRAACGDRLLTYRYVADAPLPTDEEQFNAAIQSATVEFDLLDPRTGTRTTVWEQPYGPTEGNWGTVCYAGYQNGKIYFEKRGYDADGGYTSQGLVAYDIDDGTTETVWDTWPDTYWTMRSDILPMQGDATQPYIQLTASAHVGNDLSALLNAETGEVTPITRPVENDPWGHAIYARAQTADGRWLIGIRYNEATKRYCYALIAPEALAAGSTEWQEVTMWQG